MNRKSKKGHTERRKELRSFGGKKNGRQAGNNQRKRGRDQGSHQTGSASAINHTELTVSTVAGQLVRLLAFQSVLCVRVIRLVICSPFPPNRAYWLLACHTLLPSPCPMVQCSGFFSLSLSLFLSFTRLADRLIDLALASVPLVKNEPVTLCYTVNHLICLIHLFFLPQHIHTQAHTHTSKLMSGKTWTQEVQPSELF